MRPQRTLAENASPPVGCLRFGETEGLQHRARGAPLQQHAIGEPKFDHRIRAIEVREDESGEGEVRVRRAVFRETRRSLANAHPAVIGRSGTGL